MPTFYNYTENGLVYSFDDVFVPADAFRRGTLWVWGSNSFGQLGIDDTTTNKSTPVTTFAGGTNWKQVSCAEHTGAIKTDGTLWAWGRNTSGQLGNNDTINISTPVTTFAGGANWKQVDSKGASKVAIKTDGTLWAWGNNSGKLGTNDLNIRCTPVTTFAGGANWKHVSCGNNYIAAIKTDGTLWNWGSNSFGQLGINDTTQRNTPITTFAGGENWKHVACSLHTAAIKTDGSLWTWGLNNTGQLGDNTIINRSTPVTTFAGGTNWKKVACGGNFTVAIKTDGTLWTWGYNINGQLGDNTIINRSTPVTTFAGATNWKQVAGGNTHTSAIKTDGTLWTWGDNAFGQLGTNNTITRSVPVTTFAGGTNWKQVGSGSNYTAALTYIDDYI